MGRGVPAGTSTACRVSASWSARPASASVGTLGSAATRFSADTASGRILLSWISGIAGGSDVNAIGVCPPASDWIAGPAPPNGTCTMSSFSLRRNSSPERCGTGTTPHLSGELFRLSLKLDIVHVPFGGAGPAIQSLAGGHTPMAFTSLPPAIPLIQDSKIRPLAVSAEKRVAALPSVPTLAEAGLADQEADTLQAVLVPAGTPRPIVDFLYREIKTIVALPDIKERFAVLGLDPVTNTPEEFAAQIRKEIAKWGKVIRDANIKIE